MPIVVNSHPQAWIVSSGVDEFQAQKKADTKTVSAFLAIKRLAAFSTSCYIGLRMVSST